MKNVEVRGYVTKNRIFATIQDVSFAHFLVEDICNKHGIFLKNSVKFKFSNNSVEFITCGMCPKWFVPEYEEKRILSSLFNDKTMIEKYLRMNLYIPTVITDTNEVYDSLDLYLFDYVTMSKEKYNSLVIDGYRYDDHNIYDNHKIIEIIAGAMKEACLSDTKYLNKNLEKILYRLMILCIKLNAVNEMIGISETLCYILNQKIEKEVL